MSVRARSSPAADRVAARRRQLPALGAQLAKRVSCFIPPIVVDALRRLLSEWEYLPGGWPAASELAQRVDDARIAGAQEAHWPVLVRNLEGPGPIGVSHFLRSITREDRADHNAMMSYGYVLARAARRREVISVLDWGGSLGHYWLYSRALLPEVAIDYHCHDLPRLCAVGRKMLPQVQFHEDGADALRRRYDLVVSSSSLHYFEDWRNVARKLAGATDEYLYVARLQTATRGDSFAVVQRPYSNGYHTEHISWFLNRDELVRCLEETGLVLVREFVYAEEFLVRGAPEKGDCRGFLFRRHPSVSPIEEDRMTATTTAAT